MKNKAWFENIKPPIIGLAPMHGFTNSDFRLRCRQSGADVVYSEMVAAEAIIRDVPQAFEMMKFDERERPLVIQIFGSNPKTMAQAAKIVEKKIAPDGIDINYGCPVQKAAKQGFGACQLFNPNTAAEIVKIVVENVKIPISVKIRLPSKKPRDTVDFIGLMLNSGARLVSIHARTATQKYGGHADWELLHKVKEHFGNKFILGSGDICSLQDLKDKLGNLDGALIGRAAKKDPKVFTDLQKIKL